MVFLESFRRVNYLEYDLASWDLMETGNNSV